MALRSPVGAFPLIRLRNPARSVKCQITSDKSQTSLKFQFSNLSIDACHLFGICNLKSGNTSASALSPTVNFRWGTFRFVRFGECRKPRSSFLVLLNCQKTDSAADAEAQHNEQRHQGQSP